MEREDIVVKLKNLSDKRVKEFSSRLIPTLQKDNILGVKVPILRNLAKRCYLENEYLKFILILPHQYLEENLLHAYIIEQIPDFDRCIKHVNDFLPYINDWSTCDTFKPKCFKKNLNELFKYIKIWIKSEHAYTIRYAIVMLLSYYLDDFFNYELLELVGNIKSEQYYVNMAIAWFFSTALVKQFDNTYNFLKSKTLIPWVQNKAIQKARESFRISDKNKKLLQKLKIKT